jgi:hypothetical protein
MTERKTFTRSSPSQQTNARACLRAWYREKIAGESFGFSPAQIEAFRYGTFVHKCFEDFLLDVAPMSQDPYIAVGSGLLWQKKRDIQRAAKERDLPIAHFVEQNITVPSAAGIPVFGYVDLLVPTPDKLHVIDHKTTSDPRWVRNDHEVRTDFQTIVYLEAGFQQFP